VTVDDLLPLLEGVRRSGDGFVARCPAHDDRNASLSVRQSGDELLAFCHAGCAFDDVIAAVRPARPARAPDQVTRYEIRDPAGELVAVHVRRDGPDGKRFAWERPDGITGLGGIRTAELPLYRVETLAAHPGRTVLVVEGEKAADALARVGKLAVGTVTGASSAPSAASLEPLRGREVILWPDADDPGRAHMARIAETLRPIAARVRWIELPDAAPGDDAADLLGLADDPKAALRKAGDAIRDVPEKVSAQADAPMGRNLRFVSARELAASHATTDWAIRPWIAFGAITELDGRPKAAGKSTLLAHACAAYLEGRPFLGQPTTRGPIVYLSEQPPSSLRETFGRAGLLERDELRILLYRDALGSRWPDVVDAALAECDRIGARLLVVDTLPQFAGIRGDAENDAGAALEAIAPLQAAASRGLAVVVARHDRKGGGDVGESARGSSAFTGAVDIVLALRRGEPNQRQTIRHLAALSRFEETPAETVIELTDAGYVALGSGRSVAITEARMAILEALGSGDALTIADLVEATHQSRRSVQDALGQLVDDRLVVREGAGKRGDPLRFRQFVSGSLVSAPPIRGGAETETDPEGNVVLLEARRIFGPDLREPAS